MVKSLSQNRRQLGLGTTDVEAAIVVSQKSTFQFQLSFLIGEPSNIIHQRKHQPCECSVWTPSNCISHLWTFGKSKNHGNMVSGLRIDRQELCELDRAELWQKVFILDSVAKSLPADPSVRSLV